MFLIKWTFADNSQPLTVSSPDDLLTVKRGLYISEVGKHGKLLKFSRNNDVIFLMGDPIPDQGSEITFEYLENLILGNRLYELNGIYYLIHLSSENCLSVFTSLFNLMPVFYSQPMGDVIYVASRNKLIREACSRDFTVDKQYLLERVLFNYGLFNRTYWKDISLMPTNHHIRLCDTLQIIKSLEFTDLFTETPAQGKNTLQDLADQFIELSNKYFPDERYALSFTGGFDSRTLLAVSLMQKKDFSAFAFGTGDSSDLYLPGQQAAQLQIGFMPVYLDTTYIREHSYSSAIELIRLTEGNASVSRAHYLYAAKYLSRDYRYMLTGNFGSELFRAAHLAGVMISDELYRILERSDPTGVDSVIRTSPKLRYLQRDEFRTEIAALVNEIQDYRDIYRGLNSNRMLYNLMFTEILRKYFGAELVMQSNFINSRTPYLDFGLLRAVLKTSYSGAYCDYQSRNPVKRYSGQITYAHIIRKAWSPLYNMKTNKGYRPSDLLTVKGKLVLLKNLLIKKLQNQQANFADPNAVKAAFEFNHARYAQWSVEPALYNEKLITDELMIINQNQDRGSLLNILSANRYLEMENGVTHTKESE